jgi:hypothetical protein
LVVWDTDDESKKGDPRYWWTEEAVSRLGPFSKDIGIRAGAPKGQSLASMRAGAKDGQVEWGPFGDDEEPVRTSLSRWADADPDRTRVLFAHQRAPTHAEQEAMDIGGSSVPAPVEAVRQKLLLAIKAGDERRADELRAELAEVFKSHGSQKAKDIFPWDPQLAVEVEPGLFIQDERPARR